MKNENFEATNSINESIYKLARLAKRGPSTGHNISHGNLRLLSLINKNNGAISKEFAELLDIRSSSMTEMMNQLESSGMISKNRDENDMRTIRISITPEGQKLLQEVSSGADAKFKDILTDEEKEQFILLCNKLIQGVSTNLSAECPNRHHTRKENKDGSGFGPHGKRSENHKSEKRSQHDSLHQKL